ncbi:MAG: T9SS type A sorting domain-containing protein [Bacteroidetes bacterium]|nr:T9SS type A sorting domain-containing protein [Bacteroidota bacterium]
MREKLLLTVLLLITITVHSFAGFGKKDTVMVFRPAPGLNDSTDMGTLNAGMDAWEQQPYPSANYGAHEAVYVAPISNCNSTHATAFIRFDVGSLPDTVDSVFVGFTHFDHTSYCYSNCNADFYFYPVLQRWYENTLTYGNQPTTDTAFYGPINITFPNSFGTREYNITNMYRLWRDSSVVNYGFAIKSPTVGCNNAAVIFYAHSSDDTVVATRPYLKIYYKVDTGHVDSPIHVKAVSTAKPIMKIFPNPAHTETTMQLHADHAGSGWYVISDITGRALRIDEIQWTEGDNNIRIPLYDIDAGMYYCTLYTPEGKLTGKILKQ